MAPRRVRESAESRLGIGRAIGLSAASILGMIGVVLAVNPASYGAPGLGLGLLLLVTAAVAAWRLFVGRGFRENVGSDRNRS